MNTLIQLYHPTNDNISESFDVSKLNDALVDRILNNILNNWLPMKASEYNNSITTPAQKIQAWSNIKQAFLTYVITTYNLNNFAANEAVILPQLPPNVQQLINNINAKMSGLQPNVYRSGLNGGGQKSRRPIHKSRRPRHKSRRPRHKSRRIKRR